MMLRTGGLSEILGMVQSNDEEIRDAAAAALARFVAGEYSGQVTGCERTTCA